MIDNVIKNLVDYGVRCGLVEEEDIMYSTNRILEVLGKDSYEPSEDAPEITDLEEILGKLLDYAVETGVLENDSIVYRDLFDTKLMSCLVPRQSEVGKKFWDLYKEDPRKATDYFYKFSQDTDYIRRYRIKKDMRWKVDSEYGKIDISINLSKPEKDPKAIAAAKLAPQSSYPKCLLCYENVGYAGRVNHPARQNHRIISLEINNTPWGLQYSPYVY